MPVVGEKVYTFHGLFDIGEVYNFIKNYIENSIYYYDVSEKHYSEVNDGGKREIMSKLEAVKIHNDYFQIIMKLEIMMSGKEVEVEINGKKKVLTKGTAKLTVNSYIKPDWNNGRGSSAFGKFLGALHDRFVGNDELGVCMTASAVDVGKVVAQFKQHMGAATK